MMAMSEKENYDCGYAKKEKVGPYPQYMYSTLPEGAIPATDLGIDLADKFVIEVYYEEGEQMNEG
ncbi:hypothetical protein DPMN_057125 [Dreissena polymorpha]|uniref:Uncharacterized protein n=1 Tax=Dreissena polymorpha TaxID=45954 RepID=A0A9D4CVW9_DREPO|nr:hypothetical protein DPMN_057125 [Dreissena polymorpha]